jgi:type I restriction enzyme, S subunit
MNTEKINHRATEAQREEGEEKRKLPEGWEEKKLGEIIEKTETVNPANNPDEEFIYIDVSGVNNESLKVETISTLKGKNAPSRARKLIKSGDVIFATVRPTLKRIAIIPRKYDKQICSTGYFVLRAKPDISNKLLFYYLQTESFLKCMKMLQTGASYPAVTDSQVREQPIAFPGAISEQKRIVAILDETFAVIGKARENAEKNLANTREIFESHLTNTFSNTGKGWEEKKLEEVCIIGDGNHSSNYPKAEEMVETGIPFIRANNLTDGHISDQDIKYITVEKHQQLQKGHLKTGDVLFTNRGQIGNVAIVDPRFNNSNLNSQIAWFRCRVFLHNRFLYYYLKSPIIQTMLQQQKNGTALQQFTIAQIRNICIVYPAYPEQRRIVAELDALSAQTAKLEAVYRKKIDDLDELKASILEKAFRGEL